MQVVVAVGKGWNSDLRLNPHDWWHTATAQHIKSTA
jgi:hypothetical protein